MSESKRNDEEHKHERLDGHIFKVTFKTLLVKMAEEVNMVFAFYRNHVKITTKLWENLYRDW